MMKKRRLLAACISLALCVSMASTMVASAATRFSDVKETAWYYPAVSYVEELGLFSGTSENTFSPDVKMTRSMFVTVLGRKAQIDPAGYKDSSFIDVNESQYYAPYVAWASQEGIVTGDENLLFHPDQEITREQIGTILYRYAEKYGYSTVVQGNGHTYFLDWKTTSEWANISMQWAFMNSLIIGTTEGYLYPRAVATRAEVAQIMYNTRDVFY